LREVPRQSGHTTVRQAHRPERSQRMVCPYVPALRGGSLRYRSRARSIPYGLLALKLGEGKAGLPLDTECLRAVILMRQLDEEECNVQKRNQQRICASTQEMGTLGEGHHQRWRFIYRDKKWVTQ